MTGLHHVLTAGGGRDNIRRTLPSHSWDMTSGQAGLGQIRGVLPTAPLTAHIWRLNNTAGLRELRALVPGTGQIGIRQAVSDFHNQASRVGTLGFNEHSRHSFMMPFAGSTKVAAT